jgi:hypothetical protein
MHSIYRRFGVLASLAILSVGAISNSEISSKEANVTMSFRKMSMEPTNTTVHWISPTLFQIELGDNRDACELSRIFNEELNTGINPCLNKGIRKQRGLDVPVRSAHGPLSHSEPTCEITSLRCSLIIILNSYKNITTRFYNGNYVNSTD